MKMIRNFLRNIQKVYLGKNFWKNYFKVYDNLNEAYSYQILKERVLSAAKITRGQKVLDGGCGTGNFAQQIILKGADYYGIDLIPEALEIARHKYPVIKEKFKACDLSDKLDFPDCFFERIICNNVLYTMSDKGRKTALFEFYRVLKPGGIIALTVPKIRYSPYKIYIETLRIGVKKLGKLNAYIKALKMMVPTLKILFYNYLLNLKAKKGKFHYFKREELRAEFKTAGFINISIFNVYAGETLLVEAKKLF